MQTFLPSFVYEYSAQALDSKRLNKQVLEGYQIMKILSGASETGAWRNHPAVLMWRGHEEALNQYGREMCLEWIARGYNDSMLERFVCVGDPDLPSWLGDTRLHLSHQSNLIRKDPEYYGAKFPNVSADLPYYWVAKGNNG